MRATDVFFALLALLAVGCFGVLIALQAMEWQFYADPQAPHGGNIWPAVIPSAPAR